MLIDLSCPVENQGTVVKTNTETKEPYLLLKLFNLSEKNISAVTFRVLAYDANGTEIGVIPAEFSDLSAQPKSYFAENKAVSLEGLENAKHFVVQVENATFEDGTEYTLSEENIVEVDEKNATIDDALLLREIAEEAVCFASEHEKYWRCVCGRSNIPEAEKCARCARNKEDVLKLSSVENIHAVLEEKVAEEEQKKAEEAKKLEEEKARKAENAKKIAVISAIVILVLAILGTVGYFGYKAILNKKADTALQNGDYEKAYELYQKTGSDKIGELTKYVQGNTPENLMFQSGLLSADEEFIYYLAYNQQQYTFSIIKENKQNGETKVISENAGLSLNVTKDWIYYVDNIDGYIKRVSKNGETTETVVEKIAYYLSVVGDTIYYIQTDYDNPNNLSDEQCKILAGQGQMSAYKRLYKMDAEERIPQLITDEDMSTCYIYGDRIYYLSNAKDEWQNQNLYSVDLDGNDKQSIVTFPVASFAIDQDTLYYVQIFDNKGIGSPISPDLVSYTLIRKNLLTGEEQIIAPEYMPIDLNISDNKIFFIALERQSYLDSLAQTENTTTPNKALYIMDIASGKISPLVSGEVSFFNVMGEDVVMYLGSQGMCRVKTDGTGFKEIVTPGQEVVPTEETPAETNE